MSKVDILLPSLGEIGSSLLVPVSVVSEDSGLLDIFFVVVGLLLGLLRTKIGVLLGG